jgi:hypothetical protein
MQWKNSGEGVYSFVDFSPVCVNLAILGRVFWLALLFIQVYPRFDVGPLPLAFMVGLLNSNLSGGAKYWVAAVVE